MNIFNKSFVIKLADEDDKSAHVSVSIGGVKLNATIMDNPQGNQLFRSQFDVAMDGSIYVLSAGKGLGSYDIALVEDLYDCPSGVATDSLMHDLLTDSTPTVAERTIQITVYASSSSTKSIALFNGLVVNMTHSIRAISEGTWVNILSINAKGQWSK